ncbi:hypothetical protein [Rhizobium rhizogenes]|jgi:hypothetical protein|uniref:hypothetical protein n=1 Tax=Rhizobium rhizogenes TaxID=359 RepID=UPI001F336DAC|nr:hypothetical protein [Rhizobium rhizogenes]
MSLIGLGSRADYRITDDDVDPRNNRWMMVSVRDRRFHSPAKPRLAAGHCVAM